MSSIGISQYAVIIELIDYLLSQHVLVFQVLNYVCLCIQCLYLVVSVRFIVRKYAAGFVCSQFYWAYDPLVVVCSNRCSWLTIDDTFNLGAKVHEASSC